MSGPLLLRCTAVTCYTPPGPWVWGHRDETTRVHHVSRRRGGCVALAARAQQLSSARVGALYIGLADAQSFQKELREGLRELGYIEGQNITFEFRSAEGILDRLPRLAAELVRLRVDVIIALYTPCGLAAKDATREIPIVLLTGDPLGTGLVTR